MSSTPSPPLPPLPPAATVAIGIDLGSTNCCVGVFRNEKVEIVLSDHGHRVTPSVVAFTDDEVLVGDEAKNQSLRNSANTVPIIRRLIDQSSLDCWHGDENIEKSKIQVQFKGKTERFAPKEITSMLLGKLKETAEAHLNGTQVTSAVITAPDQSQYLISASENRPIKDAATTAGFTEMRFISKPIAAAIAYGLDKKNSTAKHVLVFDLGSVTLAVSVLKLENEVFGLMFNQVKATLAGDDFDSRLVEHFVEEFKRQNQNDISNYRRALFRLRAACERAKRVLSFTTQTFIEVEALFEGVDFIAPLTRAKLEELCSELFLATLEPIKEVLNNAKLNKSQIDEIVLVGGSTRIPKMQALLKEFFDGKELKRAINPEEVVAYGAAIQAANQSNHIFAPSLKEQNLKSVTPLSLGFLVEDSVMLKVIERNTIFPVSKTIRHSVFQYNSSSFADLILCQGERATKGLQTLGTLVICPIIVQDATLLNITFDIDYSGTLKIIAQNVITGREVCTYIFVKKWYPTCETMVEQNVREAEQYQLEDETYRERVRVLREFYAYVFKTKKALEKSADEIAPWKMVLDLKRLQTMAKVVSTLEWLKKDKTMHLAKKEKLEEKRAKLEAVCKPVLDKLVQKKVSASWTWGDSS